MNQLTTIELYEDCFSFAAAHFTLFSPTSRERLHGHNYHAQASITAAVQEYGVVGFDFQVYINKLKALCESLHSYLLLPGNSSILKIEDQGQHYHVIFNQETMQLLKKDVLVLPIRNISLEELSRWFLEKLLADQQALEQYNIQAITLKVSNGHGRNSSASWQR